MTLTARYRPTLALTWLALHAWGLACWALPRDTWRWYYLAVAALELAGFVASRLGHGSWGMWSPHVVDWVQDLYTGKVIGWRGFVAHGWTIYFVAAFAAVRPWTGTDADAGIAILGFGVWLAGGHFIHYRRSKRRRHG